MSTPTSKRPEVPSVSPRLGDRFHDLEGLATDWYTEALSHETGREARFERTLELLDRLIDLGTARRVTVVGCGPRPETVRLMSERGFEVVGVEPVAGLAENARAYLGGRGTVVAGTAEHLPLDDGSQDIVFLESVLEHVDSPSRSLGEAFRVLAPGGVAFVVTTNRLAFVPSGTCAEFNVRFFNWLPALVKESYVHRHLHHEPQLANYSPRPAVHWFTFRSLCELGREAGFAHFYSHLDLLERDDPSIRGNDFKQRLLSLIQSRPWLRAIALTQAGGVVIMRKRAEGVAETSENSP